MIRESLRYYWFFVILVLAVHPWRCTTNEDDELFETEIPVVQGAYEDDNVLVLSTENFDDVVNSKEIILVEFYAPWCGHCKTLAPEYAKAAKSLKASVPPVPLAKVDGTVEGDLATRFQISGFPTLFIFRKGQKIEYDGPRTAAGIVEYMKKEADPNWKPPPEEVLTLTSENFTETVEKSKLILVEFYAPWCGHCRRLAPELERAAHILKDHPSGPILLAKVDATQEKELEQKFEVKSYPSLFIIRQGKSYKYTGPREEAGIVQYMRDQAEPPSKEVKNAKQLDNNLLNIEPTIVGLFGSDQDDLYKLYIDAANQQREEFAFLHSFDKSVAKHLSSQPGSILIRQPTVFHSKFETHQHKLTQASNPEDIISFLEEHRLPLVGLRTTSNLKVYQNFPLVVVYYDVDFGFENRAQTQLIRAEVLKVASEFKNKVTFAISNEADFNDELKALDLDDSGEDVNVGYFSGANVRYKMPPTEDFAANLLRKFIQSVQKGEVPRQFRSQPVPRTDASPVINVVGSTFEKLVTLSNKHFLLEFYAPWCKHCKNLEPVYKKVAKTLASQRTDVTVAKIDGTANDFPEDFKISGYPTIYFVTANNGKKIYYKNTSHTHDDLVKFVHEQLPSKDEL